MKYQLIGFGDDLPDWAVSTQAQLDALRAGPRGRWRRFRRCDVICERCREQLGEVMETMPTVIVTRQIVHSEDHPHAMAMADALPDAPEEDDPDAQLAHSHRIVETHQLASRLSRASATRSWWLPLEMLPEPGDEFSQFELNCKCRRVPITRSGFLAMTEGRTRLLM